MFCPGVPGKQNYVSDRWQQILLPEAGGGGICAEGLRRRAVVRVHPHICPCAKFQRNQTIRGRVIVI